MNFFCEKDCDVSGRDAMFVKCISLEKANRLIEKSVVLIRREHLMKSREIALSEKRGEYFPFDEFELYRHEPPKDSAEKIVADLAKFELESSMSLKTLADLQTRAKALNPKE